MVQYGSTKFLFSAGLDLHGWFQVSSTPAILILFSAICLSTSLLVMGGDGPETPRLYPLQHGCTSLRDVEKVIRGKVMGMPTIVFLPRFRDIIYIHDFLRSILQLFDHEKLTFTTWRHCFGHAKETTWYLAAFELTGGSCHGHLPLAAQHDQVLQISPAAFLLFFTDPEHSIDGWLQSCAHIIQINWINVLRTTLLAKISSAGTPSVIFSFQLVSLVGKFVFTI